MYSLNKTSSKESRAIARPGMGNFTASQEFKISQEREKAREEMFARKRKILYEKELQKRQKEIEQEQI